jgi:hypothetical protein
MDLIRNILEHGLQTRQSSFNFLGKNTVAWNIFRTTLTHTHVTIYIDNVSHNIQIKNNIDHS